jgi:hypothetical protein
MRILDEDETVRVNTSHPAREPFAVLLHQRPERLGRSEPFSFHVSPALCSARSIADRLTVSPYLLAQA